MNCPELLRTLGEIENPTRCHEQLLIEHVVGLLNLVEEVGTTLSNADDLPLVRLVVDDALEQLVREGVFVGLSIVKLTTESSLLTPTALANLVDGLVQFVGQQGREIFGDVDGIDRGLQFLDDGGLCEAHDLVVLFLALAHL